MNSPSHIKSNEFHSINNGRWSPFESQTNSSELSISILSGVSAFRNIGRIPFNKLKPNRILRIVHGS